MSAYDEAKKLYDKASTEWGGFRRWLALHPLTGFWSALGGGAVLGWIVGKVF